MRKKMIIILICVLCLCGCGNSWKSKFQVSSLKIENNYIVGKIKNLTNKAYDLTIRFSLKSGTLEEGEICYKLIRPNETINLECLAMDYDNYDVKIKDIEFDEIDIPKLESGEISEDVLKYYFEDINDSHGLNFISFNTDISEGKYPYISKIIYDESQNKIEISGKIEKGNNFVSYYETYNSSSEKLTSLMIFIKSDSDEFSSEVLTKVSLMRSLNLNFQNSISMLNALTRTDIEDGYCIKVGTNWCVTNSLSDTNNQYLLDAYFIHEQ